MLIARACWYLSPPCALASLFKNRLCWKGVSMHLRDRARLWMFCAVIAIFATFGVEREASAAGPGVLVLSQTSYSVQQGAGSLTIAVDRTAGGQGAIAVKYATVNGTAKAGTDYTASSGTLSWLAGDKAPKS